MSLTQALMSIERVTKVYRIGEIKVRALADASLEAYPSETCRLWGLRAQASLRS